MFSQLSIRKEEVEGIKMELRELLEDIALTGKQRERLEDFIDDLAHMAVTPIEDETPSL